MKRQLFTHLLLGALAGLALAGCATFGPSSATTPQRNPPATVLAPMPEAVTSFGAVTCDGWLYVSGGHKGERHDYSVAMVTGSTYRLQLSQGQPWEQLPSAPPAQGLTMVAYRGNVYRLGGMAAWNAPGEKQDLRSIANVLRYDPREGRWEDLPPLPQPRSSHDAVVVGDSLYVGGGWHMVGGTNAPVWLDTLLVLDLKRPQNGWQELPQPFQRRALALAAAGSRIYCIGGMDSDSKPTSAVDVYDTARRTWSKGPELPPGKFKGFACSAITQDGRIYANTFQGDLLQLAADGTAWEKVGRLEHPRMAHRLVTAGATQLIALGGEDGESKRPDLELLNPSVQEASPAATASTQTTH